MGYDSNDLFSLYAPFCQGRGNGIGHMVQFSVAQLPILVYQRNMIRELSCLLSQHIREGQVSVKVSRAVELL